MLPAAENALVSASFRHVLLKYVRSGLIDRYQALALSGKAAEFKQQLGQATVALIHGGTTSLAQHSQTRKPWHLETTWRII